MSYTPTSWSTGDTITAAAMNKIENGIANAGGGVDAVVWFPNSTEGWQIIGDFASALQKVQDGIPLAVASPSVFNSYSYGFQALGVNMLGSAWYDDNPNRIVLHLSTTNGLFWTANGVTYWEN